MEKVYEKLEEELRASAHGIISAVIQSPPLIVKGYVFSTEEVAETLRDVSNHPPRQVEDHHLFILYSEDFHSVVGAVNNGRDLLSIDRKMEKKALGFVQLADAAKDKPRILKVRRF